MTLTISSCEIHVAPERVDAGGDMTLSARVETATPADLSDHALEIRGHEGRPLGLLPFVSRDGEATLTARVTFRAPDTPGDYVWSAHPVPAEGSVTDDAPAGGTPFEVAVVPHTSRLLVWDVPSAIEAGSPFQARIGLKCSGGCAMDGRTYTVLDDAGAELASGAFSDAVWPGSEGLYYAELELTAPEAVGMVQWQVHVARHDGPPPHEAATAAFRVRTVPQADCTIRIEAVDTEKEEPLGNMSVVLHPYRGRTDQDGVAEIRVARGDYTVYVSGRGYYPVRRQLSVTQDMATRAPMEAEPPQSADW